ncbi:hypothetical protein AB205_0073970 [Aquarana catesbeiana]|uniref:MADF domain-containing protein n=1 Tax=Aquarana catesbeiana TaxID=8400 RepID=A0A2G9QAA6_AQUCT|nr:hypothetical protein AB205_0073970 [Aquarana catesbeiana]
MYYKYAGIHPLPEAVVSDSDVMSTPFLPLHPALPEHLHPHLQDKMVDKFTAPDFLPEFVKKYREMPSLASTMQGLIKEAKEEGSNGETVGINITYLKAKIGSLRSTYNRERKKVQDSQRSGASADDVYVPRLWYYNILHFLSDQTEPRSLLSTLPLTSAEAPDVQPRPFTQEEVVEEPILTQV